MEMAPSGHFVVPCDLYDNMPPPPIASQRNYGDGPFTTDNTTIPPGTHGRWDEIPDTEIVNEDTVNRYCSAETIRQYYQDLSNAMETSSCQNPSDSDEDVPAPE